LAHDRGRGQPDADAHGGDHPRRAAAQLDDRDHEHRATATGRPLPLIVVFRGRRPPLAGGALAFDALLELLSGERVEPEGAEHLAEDVVRGNIAELELLAMGADLVVDELAHRVAHHRVLLTPLEHRSPSSPPWRARAWRTAPRAARLPRRSATP